MKKPSVKQKKSLFASLLGYTRLRPLLGGVMFLLVLMLGTQVFDVASQIMKGRTPPNISPVMAEDAKPQDQASDPKKSEPAKENVKAAAAPVAPPAPAPTASSATEAKPADSKPKDTAEPASDSANKSEAAPDVSDPSLDVPDNYTDAEVAILRKLSDRRKELEKRGRELDEREALLKVSEQRVDKKISDLKDLRAQIEKMVGVATDDQKKQADSLVKIYETMKPKEAAKIFENLEMPVLINVVRRMKEARVAPILGAMDPVKAKELTAALMEKKDLPVIPK